MSALGITTAQINTAGRYTATANRISQNLGAKPTNETLNSVAQIAGIAALIPGIGTLAAGALGVVAGIAHVLSSIFGGGPTTAEQLAASRTSNDNMRAQIKTIDDQTAKMNQALQTLQRALQQNGLAGRAEDLIALNVESSATQPLQNQLAEKGRNLQVLIETFNRTVQNTYDSIYGKKTSQKIVLYGLLSVSAGLILYGLITSNKK